MLDSASTISCVSHKRDSNASLSSEACPILSSCRICLSSILDPAALTCGHRFCEGCLERYWQFKDRPGFLICPLCRAYAYDIRFEKKEEEEPKNNFRKIFSSIKDLDVGPDISESIVWCLKMSFLMPIFYYVVKWLKASVA